MSTLLSTNRNCHRRAGFTLIEMTIVIAIIAILTAMAMSVYATAAQQARGMRTRSIIAKIDQLIGEKYESYRTRQAPIRINPGTTPQNAAALRLLAIHELMRFEMPDRITDVTAGPTYVGPSGVIIPSASLYPSMSLAVLPTRPALNKQYLRRAAANANGIENWSSPNENAECLYLILATMRDGEKSALDYFSPTEIGDVDDDGMNEILDSWGQPIAFLRWAPGYRADIAPFPVTSQTMEDPDPFDPFKVDPRWTNGSALTPFALRPLIWSAGPDKRHDINVGGGFIYATTLPANDPYVNTGAIGTPTDTNGDSSLDYGDNITNHDLEAR
ncbi:MAG: type II secretion system protein [Pirellulaceae bacterium]